MEHITILGSGGFGLSLALSAYRSGHAVKVWSKFPEELEAINIMRKALNGLKPDEATDRILDMFAHTRNNGEFVNMVKKNHFI